MRQNSSQKKENGRQNVVSGTNTEPLGVGLGLRPHYISQILSENPAIPWMEAHSENYIGLPNTDGGQPLSNLLKVRKNYPLALHGVSLSIGSTDPLNLGYLKKLKRLVEIVDPIFVSDHLCWASAQGNYYHDLLPLPYTKPALGYISERIEQVQDFLGRAILIENVSSYLQFRESEFTEWEFMSMLSNKSGCYLLLDINNVYVSANNHRFSAIEYLSALPRSRIKELHLAGYSHYDDNFLIDTHDQPVTEPVWELYQQATKMYGPVPTLLERDDNYPTLAELLAEVARAKESYESALAS